MRAVTRREPEWTDTERSKVLALIDYEGQCCPGCGGYLPDTTAPEAQFAYEADNPVRCHDCTAVQRKQGKYREQEQAAALVQWPVRRRQ